MFCVFIILASQYCLVINIDEFRLLQFFILQRWLPHKIISLGNLWGLFPMPYIILVL